MVAQFSTTGSLAETDQCTTSRTWGFGSSSVYSTLREQYQAPFSETYTRRNGMQQLLHQECLLQTGHQIKHEEMFAVND
jgi:hypothetical protein